MFRFKIAPLLLEDAYVLCEVKRKDDFMAVRYRKIAEGTRKEMEELQGGQEGYYAVKLNELEDGVISGRKYTIFFQRETDEDGCLKADGKIEHYVLFEKNYLEIQGRKEHPEPSDEDDIMSDDWKENTLHT